MLLREFHGIEKDEVNIAHIDSCSEWLRTMQLN